VLSQLGGGCRRLGAIRRIRPIRSIRTPLRLRGRPVASGIYDTG
jgi:hypothetical protein